mmetsp:Transcript_1161/g.1874  ORF Transcript_1161/g.1874 Transcript_1161/m.1874 type:complete len:475 (-) Transcript_1161:29-1453(-)|eukprot:CAMPEP_0203750002 /NCGR_PEP_ID=MMETSP0098-20131031/4321_1 /ASSEMBLY_ACC=CAM_ASM_000208 /TAXON_ID=96639 /ORGANISM=" , Strain NY0313808BC1" /LENGTH=474 /DNA_ID=CAMNT_0050639125 /DNA_START=287 /DNA_END=1711 /DNA_ORIENTATION=-
MRRFLAGTAVLMASMYFSDARQRLGRSLQAQPFEPSERCFLPAVMAPLRLETITGDFEELKRKLTQMKNDGGVVAITTDVWWGKVQQDGPNSFDFGVYLTFAQAIREVGMKWVPIMSTHKCGGNVGDSCNIPIPDFAMPKTQQELDERAFGFRENHIGQVRYVTESLAPWYGDALGMYEVFFNKFAETFESYKDIIHEVYLSYGPAGELRYPSYNKETNWVYPDVGYIMAYSGGAISEFQNWAREQHATISSLNQRLGTNYGAFEDLQPPQNDKDFLTKNDCEATNGACWKTAYGHFFLTWYQEMLVRHVANVAEKATAMSHRLEAGLRGKIAGIHWKHRTNSGPLAAIAAGYYFENYEPIVTAFSKKKLGLTFTCLEMFDDWWNDSWPLDLIYKIASQCQQQNVPMSGENALESTLDKSDAYVHYNQVNAHLDNYGFQGFTLLRYESFIANQNHNIANYHHYVTKRPGVCSVN